MDSLTIRLSPLRNRFSETSRPNRVRKQDHPEKYHPIAGGRLPDRLLARKVGPNILQGSADGFADYPIKITAADRFLAYNHELMRAFGGLADDDQILLHARSVDNGHAVVADEITVFNHALGIACKRCLGILIARNIAESEGENTAALFVRSIVIVDGVFAGFLQCSIGRTIIGTHPCADILVPDITLLVEQGGQFPTLQLSQGIERYVAMLVDAGILEVVSTGAFGRGFLGIAPGFLP